MKKKKKEFSKALLIQESILIWIVTLAFLGLAALCIFKDYTGSLPWLTAMVSLPWTAYGVSQACYYNKAAKENTKDGIKYDAVMAEINNQNNNEKEILSPEFDLNNSDSDSENLDIDIDYGI